ncbi:oligopeptide ABC transporter substrate-binding protein [Lactobacillaceae bacterium Scapto_B20]
MKNKKKWLTAGIAMLSALSLAACSNSNNSNSENGSSKAPNLASSYNTSGKGTTAGNNSTLKVAEINNSPFAGITSPSLITNAEDNDVYSPGFQTLFNNDKNYKIVDGGLANLKLDKSAKTATITIRKDAKWSNGMKVTAKDVEYPYEIIANPKSQSQQYSVDMNKIEGVAEYHAGKAKTISGFTYPDGQSGRVVKIKFNSFPPSLQYNGNSTMWQYIEPYEYLKNVPIDKLASSDQVRKNPIFVGPYKLSKQVQGESTSWVPNPYYFGSKAKIKNISIQVVSSNNFAASIKANKYDFTFGGVSSQYPDVKNLKNYTMVGSPAMSFSYFGFNLGHANSKGVSVTDKNAKMANKNLRQALMYAINLDQVYDKFGNGLRWRANTLLPPAFKQYYDSSLPGFKYDPKKAAKLLDDAGYKKKGKWRVQPNGKPLKINFGAMAGSTTSEAIQQYELQEWHKLGLNVQYAGGKPMEMNSFYSILQKPKQNQIDFYNAAFSTNSEPTPTGLFGTAAAFNMGHFANKENDQLMNNEKAWDNNYRVKQFKDWQKFMNEETAYAPDSFSYSWSPVSKRVVNYTTSPANANFWNDLQLNSASIK